MSGQNLENKTQEIELNRTNFFGKVRQVHDYLTYSQYENLDIEEAAERKVTNFLWKTSILSSIYFAGAYSQSGKTEDLIVAICSGIGVLLSGILKLHNAYEDSQYPR